MRIYNSQHQLISKGSIHTLFLEFENEWEWTSDINEALIIPTIGIEDLSSISANINNNHILLVLDIFNSCEGIHLDQYFRDYFERLKKITQKVIIAHTNISYNTSKCFFYDHMFNRHKLYYLDFKEEYNLSNRVWTYNCYREMFNLNTLHKTKECKKFLAPMRIDLSNPVQSRMVRRNELKKVLENYDGFLSDDQVLLPNIKENTALPVNIARGGSWYPVGDTYYESSFISIFVETIAHDTVHGKYELVTEKTFDPLIKGHFILPFGYCGLVNTIKKHYGFRFPDWIDYSYDDIKNDDERFLAFLLSVKKVLDYSLQELYELYNKDIDILIHNRQVFFNKPYDSLYQKVQKAIELLK